MQAFHKPQIDPFRQFQLWFDHVVSSQCIAQPTAACLSTVDSKGMPDARFVLLKGFDEHGFVIYTNLQSPKGRQLEKHPKAALTFFWDYGRPGSRQVRLQGDTELVSSQEADAYWASRPRLSQLGSLTSRQSEPLGSRLQFMKELARNAARFGVGAIPRPEHWTGIRLIPLRFEFWQSRPNRLHDRFLYTRKGASWTIQRLYP